jgi:hypothetical protein
MTQAEMFNKSFERPKNFFSLTAKEQWDIDSKLGILDWVGTDLSHDDYVKFNAHYGGSGVTPTVKKDIVIKEKKVVTKAPKVKKEKV